MDPSAYLTALRRRWPLVVATIGISVILASFTASLAQGEESSEYSARAVLLGHGVTDKSTGTNNLATLATLTGIGPIPERVAEAIDFKGDPGALAQRLETHAAPNLGFLWLTATSTDPAEAELIAHTYADEIVEFIREDRAEGALLQSRQLDREMRQLENQIATLEDQIAASNSPLLIAKRDARIRHFGDLAEQQQVLTTAAVSPGGLSIIDKSSAEPVTSAGGVSLGDPLTRILVGTILGLLAGVALALALERFDTRIRTKQAAETHFSFPVLAEIPAGPRRTRRDHAIVAAEEPNSPFAAAFRLLATTGLTGRVPADGTLGPAEQVVALQPPQTILVTSPAAGEGKTTVTANLAASFAEQGKKTLVVSCDFRNPHIHRMFGVPNDKGLAEALRSPNDGRMLVDGHVQKTSIREIRVVPSSAGADNPGGLLGSNNMHQVLQEARENADVVLLDTPPILTGSEAALLFPEVDAVLVVARAGTTTVELAERTSELLKRLGTPVIGVALNGATGVSAPRHAYRDVNKPSDEQPTKKESPGSDQKSSAKATTPAAPVKETRGSRPRDQKTKEGPPSGADVGSAVVEPAVPPSSAGRKANAETQPPAKPAGAEGSREMRKWEL
jgi:capsular exopolysaccharide synthesis family protein